MAVQWDCNQLLGTGMFSAVYRGTYNGKPVAIKKALLINTIENDREERALMNLDHANIIKLLHRVDEVPYRCFVLELCAGTLSDYCVGKYSGPMPKTKDCLLHMAKGLAFIHLKNFVHRDIKPENILVSAAAESRPVSLKISDFGLCKTTSASGAFSVSEVRGTPIYLAAEVLQHLDGHTVEKHKTIASDVFAMGCTFFYFLSRGSHPFGSPLYVTANIMNGKQETKKLYGHPVLPLIRQMILRNPENRPKMDDAVAELERTELTSEEEWTSDSDDVFDDPDASGFQPNLSPVCEPLSVLNASILSFSKMSGSSQDSASSVWQPELERSQSASNFISERLQIVEPTDYSDPRRRLSEPDMKRQLAPVLKRSRSSFASSKVTSTPPSARPKSPRVFLFPSPVASSPTCAQRPPLSAQLQCSIDRLSKPKVAASNPNPSRRDSLRPSRPSSPTSVRTAGTSTLTKMVPASVRIGAPAPNQFNERTSKASTSSSSTLTSVSTRGARSASAGTPKITRSLSSSSTSSAQSRRDWVDGRHQGNVKEMAERFERLQTPDEGKSKARKKPPAKSKDVRLQDPPRSGATSTTPESTGRFLKCQRDCYELGSSGGVNHCRFHPSKPKLACALDGSKIVIFDGQTHATPFTEWRPSHWQLDARCTVSRIDWDAAGGQLAAGCSDGTVAVWSEGGTKSFETREHHSYVNCVRWNREDRGAHIFLTGDSSGVLVVWDSNLCCPIRQYYGGSNADSFDDIRDVCWIRFDTFASCCFENAVRIWQLRLRSPIRILGLKHSAHALRWNAPSSQLAACSSDGSVTIWSLKRDELLAEFENVGGRPLICLDWRRKKSQIACGGDAFLLAILDLSEGVTSQPLLLEGHSGWMRSVAYSHDGEYLASVDCNGNIRIWLTSTWHMTYAGYSQYSSHLDCLSWDGSDGKLAVANSSPDVIVIDWHLPSPIGQPSSIRTAGSIKKPRRFFYQSDPNDDSTT